MNALVESRSFLDFILSPFSSKAKPSPAPTVEAPPERYNPFDTLCRMDRHSLRAVCANAAHLASPADSHVFFDPEDDDICHSDVRHGTGELADLVRARHQFKESMRDWGFGATVGRCRITGDLGLNISRGVVKDCTLEDLHTIPHYELLRTELKIPTTLGREWTDEVNVVEYFVECFVRHDQLADVGAVRTALMAIERELDETMRRRRKKH